MKRTARKLFFALWPSPEVAAATLTQARACGMNGRPVAPEKLHLTLAFLGEVPASALPALRAAAGEVAVPEFELTLARTGYFRGPAIAWLGPAAAPGPLLDLAAAVRDAAAAAGVERPGRGFRPHVTVVRRASEPRRARLPEPVYWPVTAFSLSESMQVDGRAEYRDIERWPLGPASVE